VTTERSTITPSALHATATGLRVRPDLYDEDYTSDEYEQMLSMYEGTMSQIVEGEIVKSKVLRITDSAVILDVGFKSEGSVPLDEFKERPAPGDEVEVFLEHLEDQEGAVVLSKKKADFMRVWEKIKQAHETDQPVQGTLVKKIKGGVVVNLMGVDAFLPGRSRCAGCPISTNCWGRVTSSRSSSSTSAAATSWSAAGSSSRASGPTSVST
jgi:S1 domain